MNTEKNIENNDCAFRDAVSFNSDTCIGFNWSY